MMPFFPLKAAPVAHGGSQARESELQLPTYTTATATPDQSHICDLHRSSQQCQILNPMIETRDQTRNLTVPTRMHFHCAIKGTPMMPLYYLFFFLVAPSACGTSWDRDGTRIAVATCATAVAMPDP